jgi:hypothetical protein
MKLRGVLGPAAATFALLLAAGCSQAPPPATPTAQARAARNVGDPSGTAPAAAAKQAAATPASTAKAAAPHSSEAEPKAAPAAASMAAAPAAAAPVAPAAAATPAAPPAPPTPPSAAAQKPAAAPGDPSVIVVDQPDYDPSSQLTLAQAAKAERERKADAVPPRIVINNKNLHRYAKGGQLTVADPKKKKKEAAAAVAAGAVPTAPSAASGKAAAGGVAAAGGAASAGAAGSPGAERDERYWRARALEIRERWHNAAERVKGLEQDVSEWRRRFYAQDDPWVRDGQIKPAWDHALEELRASRAAVVSAQKELAEFQEEGRIAGALPGWLREGIDLEPKEAPPVDPAQGIETPIYKEPGPPR